jgi:hypothetical protein
MERLWFESRKSLTLDPASAGAPSSVAENAAQAGDNEAWAFWLEVERAVKELLAEATPPDVAQH